MLNRFRNWLLFPIIEDFAMSHNIIHERLLKMSKELDDLTASVKRSETVSDSIVTLVQGLAQQLRDAANDPAAIEALAAELDTKTSAVSDAVTANTPAAPAA